MISEVEAGREDAVITVYLTTVVSGQSIRPCLTPVLNQPEGALSHLVSCPYGPACLAI